MAALCGRPYTSTRKVSTPLITGHDLALSPVEGSLITGFLIDTPAIRNTSKSCACIAESHSNRHSSDACNVHQNRAISLTAGREIVAPKAPGDPMARRPHARIARMMTEAAEIAANIEGIRERIARAAERATKRAANVSKPAPNVNGGVKIVAISKTFSANALRSAYDAGLRDFGENRVQEWESKRAQLSDLAAMDATWHMIGHVQGNKAARVAQLFHRVDSLDRLAVAQKLDSAAAAEGKRLPVLIEVHLGGESSKTGVAEADLAALAQAAAALAHLDLQGLMTIPPYFEDAEQVRPYFRKLRELRDALSATLGRELPVLSMGMSHDFEVAVEEGATEVRIGSAIFGARKPSE